MKIRTARQIVSGATFLDEKLGKWATERNVRTNTAKNLLRRRHKTERQRKRLARRKLQGLH